jgi:hypothetical protein
MIVFYLLEPFSRRLRQVMTLLGRISGVRLERPL